jgi:putative copper resistance protein D
VSFIDVLLRGASLSGQALAAGGVAFALLVLRGWTIDDDGRPLLRRVLDLTALGASVLAITQGAALVLDLGTLADGGEWPLSAALGTLYVKAGLARLLGSAMLVLAAVVLARRGRARGWWWVFTGAALVIATASAGMSHAVAQLDGRAPLAALTAIHQIAAAVWVGGLVHLVLTAFRRESPAPVRLLQRFSNVALVSVVTLAASGVALAAFYIRSPAALVGTAYGFMVLTKTVILGGLVVFGAVNDRALRRLRDGRAVMPRHVRQFLEVEIGLGITVLFVAASLTSTPPAKDVVADRATGAEVATIFTPQWPRLTSPTHAELASASTLGDRAELRTGEDTAWSEYNHHVAGAFVLSLGMLAVLSQMSWGRWARHWPLLLLGLATFLFVRDDPETWPLGPIGFWESMNDVEVVQHRLFVLLLVVFGVFEWMVRTRRLESPRWAYVFPLLCAVGGAFLLTHSHALNNIKREFLMEITHTPLALLGLVAGWARWLELRLPDRGARLPERVWSVALVLVGILLLMYREG